MYSKVFWIGLVGLALLASSPVQGATIYVPDHQPTIQAGIDAAANGDEVVVRDDTYSGVGNRDIDFLGKAITVRSENGPDNCTVDCEGSPGGYHRGFYFHSGEDENSVLDGFTVINGYMESAWLGTYGGAGIYCGDSSPTIMNNVISSNEAWVSGGGISYCPPEKARHLLVCSVMMLLAQRKEPLGRL